MYLYLFEDQTHMNIQCIMFDITFSYLSAGELIDNFLQNTASQLTVYGCVLTI